MVMIIIYLQLLQLQQQEQLLQVQTAAGVTTEELTSLTANTIYYFWVRSNCGGGEVSSWVSGGSFNTLEGNTCGLVQDLASLTSPYSGTTVGFSNSFTNSCLTGTGGDRIF